MTIESKRRAVFTVLSEYVRDEALWDAMWRWQNDFSDKSQFELNGFLSHCRDIPGIAENRPQLYRQLISVLMDHAARLKPDPMEQMLAFQAMQASGGSVVQASKPAADWSPVYSRVLDAVFTQLRSDTVRLVKRFATEQAVRHGLPQGLAYAFTLWEERGDPMNVQGVPLVQLKQLLNYIYIGLCEYLGPVDADRILSQSIKSAQAAGPSVATDPRLLLEK